MTFTGPFWYICILKNAIWVVQCPGHFPLLYDSYIQWSYQRYLRSIKLDKDFKEEWGNELGPELGEMPLYGLWGNSVGHKISEYGIEVDKAKIDTIEKLPPPSVKAIRSFLGHAGFYQHFIKDFSKITRPHTKLLKKDVHFEISTECLLPFETLKEKLVNALIVITPN